MFTFAFFVYWVRCGSWYFGLGFAELVGFGVIVLERGLSWVLVVFDTCLCCELVRVAFDCLV